MIAADREQGRGEEVTAEPFSEFYDRYLAELAQEGVSVPTESEMWATVYLSCNVAAWRDRDNKKVLK